MVCKVAAFAALIVLAPLTALAVTQSQIDSWLATSLNIVRQKSPSPNIQKTYVSVKGVEGATGWIDPDTAQIGELANGQQVMIVPIESGGSGGVFTTLLFTKLAGKTRFVGTIPSQSGHLDVYLDSGRIIVKTPIYKASDPNCCPSGHHYERATLNGIRLVTSERWDDLPPGK